MEEGFSKRLCCPVCAGALDARPFDDSFWRGLLTCARCRTWYPVHGGIPVLLDFRVDFHERFASEESARLAELPGFHPPVGSPRPGERSTQRTFTEEWGLLQESEVWFHYTAEELVQLLRDVQLRWYRPGSTRVRSILDVGCGLGHETHALAQALPGAETIGIDVNLALLESPLTRQPPKNVRFVVASLFALPFPRSSFDLVYSNGVLHHTHSTEQAFDAVADFVAADGRFFLWVYGGGFATPASSSRFRVAVGSVAEAVGRPLLSRSPEPLRNAFFKALTPYAHRRLLRRVRHPERWQRMNTEHTLRDMLSPRYAHRQNYNTVIEWFENRGLEIEAVQSARRYKQLFDYPAFGVGVTGRRTAPVLSDALGAA